MLVFTIFIGVVATVYISVTRSLRHASEVRKVYAESRYLMDRITQDVRLYTIDYDCYEEMLDGDFDDHGTYQYGECNISSLGSDGKSDVLALIAADGSHRAVYKFDDSGDVGKFLILELDRLVNIDGSIDWEPAEGFYTGFQEFQMDKVEMDDVSFTIWPLMSPYTHFDDDAQYQPSVQVVIAARSTSTFLPDVVNVLMQSTISSRVYGVTF